MRALVIVSILILWWAFFSARRSGRKEFRATHHYDHLTGLWRDKR